jgi:hypothetical protein
MRRREFLRMLGGAVSAWPAVAHAQKPERDEVKLAIF